MYVRTKVLLFSLPFPIDYYRSRASNSIGFSYGELISVRVPIRSTYNAVSNSHVPSAKKVVSSRSVPLSAIKLWAGLAAESWRFKKKLFSFRPMVSFHGGLSCR